MRYTHPMLMPEVSAFIFPHLANYLGTLPGGMDAYPLARTRADYSIILRRQIGSLVDARTLPADVHHRLLRAPLDPGSWIRETTYGMLAALCRDVLWKNPGAYHRGMFDAADEMYKSSLHRHLMRLLSPRLVVMGAAMRWKNFHQGSSLSLAETTKQSVVARLEFPNMLFNTMTLDSLAATFCAAVAASGASTPQATVSKVQPTSAQFLLTWT